MYALMFISLFRDIISFGEFEKQTTHSEMSLKPKQSVLKEEKITHKKYLKNVHCPQQLGKWKIKTILRFPFTLSWLQRLRKEQTTTVDSHMGKEDPN